MRRLRLAAVALALVAGGCSDDGSPAVTPDPHQARPQAETISTPEFAVGTDDPCSGATIGDWIAGDAVIVGKIVEIGPRERVGPIDSVARYLTVATTEILYEPEGSPTLPAEPVILLPEWREVNEGIATRSSTVHADQLSEDTQVLLILRTRNVGEHVRDGVVAGVAQLTGSAIDFSGPCTPPLRAAAQTINAELAYDNEMDMLIAWGRALATGTTKTFTVAEAAATTTPTADERWRAADPARRSLSPADVPADIATKLDVRAAFVDVTGLEFHTITFRTESGNSGGIAAAAMGSVSPVYFVDGEDIQVEVVLSGQPETVLGSITIEEIKSDGIGGLLITGTAPNDINIDTISETSLADLLAMSRDQLEALRESFRTATGND